MYFKIIIYIIFSLIFLFIGLFTSNLLIDKDPVSQRIYGKAKVIFNIDYGFYNLEHLDFKITQLFHFTENIYSSDTNLITISSLKKDDIIKQFDLFKKEISELDNSLKKLLQERYIYNKNMIDFYIEESNKLTNTNNANLNNIIYNIRVKNKDLDIYINNLKNKDFEHNFIRLSNVEYYKEHLDISYNSTILITLLFTVLGVFIAWCILEIRSFFSRRNSL